MTASSEGDPPHDESAEYPVEWGKIHAINNNSQLLARSGLQTILLDPVSSVPDFHALLVLARLRRR